jgi:hypothetical protein
MNLQESIRRILREETELPLYIRRRVSMEELDDLVLDVKDLIDSNYDKTDAIYDTVRQFVATKKEFKFKDETEQAYWDSYIEVEEPLVNYVKTNLHESIRRILREEAGLPLYLKRRISLREIEHDFNMLINFEIKSVRNRDLSLEEFKRKIVSTLMDIFHGALSDWGKVDFDYDYIYDSLMNYFSPRITEKYIEHLYNG